MISRRGALLRSLQGYIERTGILWREVVISPLVNERCVDATFRHRARVVAVRTVANSEDQEDHFDGQCWSHGLLAAHIDNGPVIQGPNNQATWDSIMSNLNSERPGASVQPSPPRPAAVATPVPLATADDFIVRILKMLDEIDPQRAGVLAKLLLTHPDYQNLFTELLTHPDFHGLLSLRPSRLTTTTEALPTEAPPPEMGFLPPPPEPPDLPPELPWYRRGPPRVTGDSWAG
jgi:hypothetical protein